MKSIQNEISSTISFFDPPVPNQPSTSVLHTTPSSFYSVLSFSSVVVPLSTLPMKTPIVPKLGCSREVIVTSCVE